MSSQKSTAPAEHARACSRVAGFLVDAGLAFALGLVVACAGSTPAAAPGPVPGGTSNSPLPLPVPGASIRAEVRTEPLAPGQVARLARSKLRVDNGDVCAVDASSDGSVVLLASRSAAHLFRGGDGVETAKLPFDGLITTAVLDPSGRTLAVVGSKAGAEDLYLVDVATRAWKRLGLSGVHPVRREAMGWSPDGRRLAVRSGDDRILLVDPSRGTASAAFASPREYAQLYAMRWSPDSTTLAAVYSRETLALFKEADSGPLDAKPHAPARVIELAEGAPLGNGFDLDWSPDGRRLAVRRRDVVVVDLEHEGAQTRIDTHSLRGKNIAFSPDGQSLAESADGTGVRIWNLATRAKSSEVPAEPGSDLLWRNDRLLIVAGSAASLFSTKAGAAPPSSIDLGVGHHGPIRNLEFSLDGQRLFSSGEDGQLIGWDLATGAGRSMFSRPGSVIFASRTSADGSAVLDVRSRTGSGGYGALVAIAADGRRLAEVEGLGSSFPFLDSSGALVGSDGARHKLLFAASGGAAREESFAPDTVLDVTSDGTKLVVAEAASGKAAILFRKDQRRIALALRGGATVCRFSADASAVSCQGRDRQGDWLGIADAAGAARLAVDLPSDAASAQKLAISPDGRAIALVLARGGRSPEGRVYGVVDGGSFVPFTPIEDLDALAVHASRERGVRLATGDSAGTVALWDASRLPRP